MDVGVLLESQLQHAVDRPLVHCARYASVRLGVQKFTSRYV